MLPPEVVNDVPVRTLRAILLALLGAAAPVAILAACSSGTSGGQGGTSDPSCNGLSSACPATPPSYQSDVQPLIVTYCYQCHGPGGIEQGQFDYTTYEGVYKNRSEMLTQVYQCQMPPYDASPPASAMPDETARQTIVSWLACGAPNN
jgi:hypothetical protein